MPTGDHRSENAGFFVSLKLSNIAHSLFSFAVNGRRLSYIAQSFHCAKPDLSIDLHAAKPARIFPPRRIYLCQQMELSMTEIRAAAQVPVPAGQISERFGRRRCLAWSSTALLGAIAFGGKLPGLSIEQALAQTPGGASMAKAVDLGEGDVGILNFAYALEQLEAAFYTQVTKTPYSIWHLQIPQF
jgi:hypothetical protein